MKRHNSIIWFVIASVALVIVVWIVTFSIAQCWNLQEQQGRLSFGQFIMQSLLLPAAVIGFILTVQQIRKAQEVTDLHLYWSTGVGRVGRELVLKIPSTSEITRDFRLELLNEGHLVAVWYLVEFRIPKVLALLDCVPIIGKMGDDWKRTQLEDGKDFTLFSFRSKGQEAAYPGYGLQLATISVRLYRNRKYPPYCEIPYIIATDRGKPQKGVLKLKLERESKQEENKNS